MHTRSSGVKAAVVLAALLAGNLLSFSADTSDGPRKSAKAAAIKTQRKQRAHKTGAAPAAQRNAQSAQAAESASAAAPKSDPGEVNSLKEQLAAQQKQIEQLRSMVEKLLERGTQAEPAQAARAAQGIEQKGQVVSASAAQSPNLPQVASLVPVVQMAKAVVSSAPLLGPAEPAKVPAGQDDGLAKKLDAMGKNVEKVAAGLGGFKFGGDLRFRTDMQLRSASSVAGPLQNVRERYRLRFSVNKALSENIDAHVQLGSGTFSNPQTFDTDFAATGSRGPIFIDEYWAAYHNKNLELRAGKMPEVFADDARFAWDDDLRLNGFHQIVKIPLASKPLGIARAEVRAGQYILTNPNVPIVPPGSPYIAAGYPVGSKVRAADLFDQGFGLFGDIKTDWSHQFLADIQWYRNVNQIQLASTGAAGAAALINPYYGLTLPGGVGQVGNATTTPGGSAFTAAHYHVVRVGYRVTHTGWKTSRQVLPVWIDLQAARNVGASFERTAYMGTVSIGAVQKFGDLRFMYLYAVKQANSMISQFTDDDLGTGVGVNIRTHHFRVDLGLNKFLQWQNLLFIQDELSPNDPARSFFVPLQKGAESTYRIQSQFAINF